MNRFCRRITAWILCAVVVFMEFAPSVYADDVVEPVVTERDYEVSVNELTEYSPEWCERYGVDTDIVFMDYETGDIDTEYPDDGYSVENANAIYYFLRNDMGLHSAAAVGILTNAFSESTFRPDALGDGGTSYGIFQWHAGRWEKLKNYCNDHGYDWHTLDGQLHYLKHETDNDYPNTMAAIRGTSNDADGAWYSAYCFCKNFEVPADTIAKSQQRGDLARDKFWPIYGEPDADNPDKPAEPTPTEAPKKEIEVKPVPEEIQPSQEEDGEAEDLPSMVLEEDMPADGIIPEGIWFAGIEDKDYTGSKIVQDFRVYYSDQMLKEKKDYTVDYYNNKLAGKAVVTISLKGNYSGVFNKSFTIKALDIEEADSPDITLNYTGKEQKPKPEVSLHGTKLKYERDFTVPAYSKSGFTGSAYGNVSVSVDICGCGNYSGTKTIYITYIGKQTVSGQKIPQVMMSKVKASSIPNQEYDPDGYEAISLSQNNLRTKKGGKYVLTLKYKGKTLSENDVEVVGIEGGDMPGKAYLVIRGRNAQESATGYSFIGEKRLGFKIKGLSLKGLKISGIEKSYAYTGEEICPVPVISGVSGLTKDDYSVSYEDNIMPGKATIVVKGQNRYSGGKKKSFKINGVSIEKSVMALYYEGGTPVSGNSTPEVEYKRDGAVIKASLSFNGIRLVEGTDYKVSYKNNKTAGKATMQIKGMGRFEGSIKLDYKVRAKDFSDNIRMYAADKTLGGGFESKLWVVDIDGTQLKAGKDYTEPKYYIRKGKKIYTVDDSDVPQAGMEIYVAVTGKGGYSAETLYTKYTIIKKANSLTKATISIKDQQYTGNQIKITSQDQIAAAVLDGKKLTLGVDFVIIPGSYVDNINKGTAKVTVRGCGDYTGQKTLTFRINVRTASQ